MFVETEMLNDILQLRGFLKKEKIIIDYNLNLHNKVLTWMKDMFSD